MTNKREVTMGLVFGVAALAAIRAGTGAATAATETEALEALNPWADALFSGDPAQVEKVLAPEATSSRPPLAMCWSFAIQSKPTRPLTASRYKVWGHGFQSSVRRPAFG
jgi:hypothetical protein